MITEIFQETMTYVVCFSPKLMSRNDFYVVRCDLSIKSTFFLSWFLIQCNIVMCLTIEEYFLLHRKTWHIQMLSLPRGPNHLLVSGTMLHTAKGIIAWVLK